MSNLPFVPLFCGFEASITLQKSVLRVVKLLYLYFHTTSLQGEIK